MQNNGFIARDHMRLVFVNNGKATFYNLITVDLREKPMICESETIYKIS
jgi:hypothetical protein